jgi:hypothetical protein
LTPVAPQTDPLQELEAETRLAWSAYSERLRDLDRQQYELAEPESWAELQSDLQRLEHQRESLVTAAPGVD